MRFSRCPSPTPLTESRRVCLPVADFDNKSGLDIPALARALLVDHAFYKQLASYTIAKTIVDSLAVSCAFPKSAIRQSAIRFP